MPADRPHTPEEAQQLVLERVRLLGVERVSLINSLGRLLAADVVAPYDNPPLDNSAMDGYAVRYEDVKGSTPERPAVLEMIEDIPAGYIGKKTVGPQQTSRIMTGAPVPAGADTVIRVEDTKADVTQIQIFDAEELGDNIRRRGEDMKTGELLLPAGTELGPGEVAALASAPAYARFRSPPTDGYHFVHRRRARRARRAPRTGEDRQQQHDSPRRHGDSPRRRADHAAHGTG